MTEQQNRFPRDIMESPSLEIFQNLSEQDLEKPAVAEQRGWIRQSSDILSNLCCLWFCMCSSPASTWKRSLFQNRREFDFCLSPSSSIYLMFHCCTELPNMYQVKSKEHLDKHPAKRKRTILCLLFLQLKAVHLSSERQRTALPLFM